MKLVKRFHVLKQKANHSCPDWKSRRGVRSKSFQVGFYTLKIKISSARYLKLTSNKLLLLLLESFDLWLTLNCCLSSYTVMILINATKNYGKIKQSAISKQLPGTLTQLRCQQKGCELDASNKPKTARESYGAEIIEFYCWWNFQSQLFQKLYFDMSLEKRKNLGRSTKITEKVERNIVREFKKNPFWAHPNWPKWQIINLRRRQFDKILSGESTGAELPSQNSKLHRKIAQNDLVENPAFGKNSKFQQVDHFFGWN